MTKLIITTFAILASSALADSTSVPQWAQEKRPVIISYYLGIGTSFPLGEMAKTWNPYLNLFGRLDFSVSPKLNIWSGVDYNLFSPGVGRKFRSINLTGDLKIDAGKSTQKINPYLFVGIGLAITDTSDADPTLSPSNQTDALLEIGGGVGYKTFFIQGRYLSIMSYKYPRSYIPVTLGMKF